MLRFDHPMPPRTKAHRVVTEALQYFTAWLQDKGAAGTARQLERYRLGCFSFGQLVGEAGRLLAAHEDRAHVYHLTEYHWLLLDRALKHAFVAHNRRAAAAEKAGSRGTQPPVLRSVGPRQADYEAFRAMWFWDIDYDLPADMVNAMNQAHKEYLGIAEGTFACANRLPVHDSDLVMKREALRGRERNDSW